MDAVSLPTLAPSARQSVKGKAPLGVIDILNATAKACPDYPNRQHVFRLRTIRAASFLFAAMDEEDVQRWVDNLTIAGRGGMDENGTVAIGLRNGPSLFDG